MYVLDKEKNEPLYIQLYNAIKKEITHHLQAGAKLPSVRKVSLEYAISKNTVELAYKQLYAEGYIESVPKSGYFVSETFCETYPNATVSSYKSKEQKSIVRYDFFPARLTHDAFPLKLWKRLFSKAMEEELDFGAYGDRQGELKLREEIAKYLIKSRGVVCDASQIIVCGGFEDSMHLIASLFKNSLHEVAIEDPGYPIVSHVFSDYGYTISPIEVNQQGLNIDQLEASSAKLVYITPSHQYPTGVSMPISHRLRMLQWAKRAQGIIIEDDYDSELRYNNRPIPSLQGLDHEESVIYVGTFSKSLSPALRISYLVLPHRFLPSFHQRFKTRHPSVPLGTQKTLALFMKEGHWERHLRKIRTLNRKKHDLMREMLKSTFGSMITIISEGGGLAIILRPTIEIDLHTLRENALHEGIKLYLASEHYGQRWEALRMGFGGLQESEIVDAITLLKKIWEKTL